MEMKKIIIIMMFFASVSSSFAQTIEWKKLASLPEGYSSGEAVTLNNEIYFVSGRSSVSKSAHFYKFNPLENQWTKLADLPQPMMNLALAAVKEKIYAFGGDPFLNVNFEYTPETNTWKSLRPMPTARQHIDCGIFGDSIFIMGGLTSWTLISKKNEVYNVATDSWSDKSAVPSLRNNPAIVTKDSLIYVIGGGGSDTGIWDETASVECYHVKSNTWEKKTDLPYILFKPASVVVNNTIVVLGGSTTINENSDSVDKVLIYQSEIDNWIETTPLPAKNIFFGCTSIGNRIYIIGGTPGASSDWSSYASVYEGTFIPEKTKEQ